MHEKWTGGANKNRELGKQTYWCNSKYICNPTKILHYSCKYDVTKIEV